MRSHPSRETTFKSANSTCERLSSTWTVEEAIEFGRSGVPGLSIQPTSTHAITERYVIEFIRWQSIQDQPIDRNHHHQAQTDPWARTMGADESSACAIELFKPEQWVAAFVLTQQWARQHRDSRHQDRLKQAGLKVGCTVLPLTLKVFTSPDPSDTPWSRDSRRSQSTGQDMEPTTSAHLHHCGGRDRCWNRADPRHQNHVNLLLTDNLGDSPDHLNAPAAKHTFLTIVDQTVRLADLPIGRMEDHWHQRRWAVAFVTATPSSLISAHSVLASTPKSAMFRVETHAMRRVCLRFKFHFDARPLLGFFIPLNRSPGSSNWDPAM